MGNTVANSNEKTSVTSIFLIVAAVVVCVALMINSVYFRQTRELSGIVESSGSADSRVGNREYASIKLENGVTVHARVVAIGALRTGETVKVQEQKRFFGPPIFQVVSIEPRQ
jgi:hypothetical protein